MKPYAFSLLLMVLASYASFAQKSECDYKVEILVDAEEFEKNEFMWRMRVTKESGNPSNISGTAQIEDTAGKIVKKYKPWTYELIPKQRTSNKYSPNLKEGEEYKLTASIDSMCYDINKDNNIDAKTIKIKGAKEVTKKKSVTKGTNSDVSASEGGNWIIEEEISSRKPEATITKKPKIKEKIESNNEESTVQLKSAESNNKNHEINVPQYQAQNTQTVYESSNEKAKRLIMVSLLIVSILINVVLIWKR